MVEVMLARGVGEVLVSPDILLHPRQAAQPLQGVPLQQRGQELHLGCGQGEWMGTAMLHASRQRLREING